MTLNRFWSRRSSASYYQTCQRSWNKF